MGLISFYVTFGRRYEKVIHPVWTGLNPCGYLKVNAKKYKEARGLAAALFGRHFDEVLTSEEMLECKEFYPCGMLKEITIEYERGKPLFDVGEIVKELKTDL